MAQWIQWFFGATWFPGPSCFLDSNGFLISGILGATEFKCVTSQTIIAAAEFALCRGRCLRCAFLLCNTFLLAMVSFKQIEMFQILNR